MLYTLTLWFLLFGFSGNVNQTVPVSQPQAAASLSHDSDGYGIGGSPVSLSHDSDGYGIGGSPVQSR